MPHRDGLGLAGPSAPSTTVRKGQGAFNPNQTFCFNWNIWLGQGEPLVGKWSSQRSLSAPCQAYLAPLSPLGNVPGLICALVLSKPPVGYMGWPPKGPRTILFPLSHSSATFFPLLLFCKVDALLFG